MNLLILFGQVFESNPAFSILDPLELLADFWLIVAAALNDLPEAEELLKFNLAVLIYVDLVEKLLGRNFAEASLPVVERLIHVDRVALVRIKQPENFLDLLLQLTGETLNIRFI